MRPEHFLIVGAVTIAVGVIILGFLKIKSERRRVRLKRETEIEKVLFQEIRKKGASKIDHNHIAERHHVTLDIVYSAATKLYSRCCERALEDLQITEKERAILEKLGAVLALTSSQMQEVEQGVRNRLLRSEVDMALADGVVTVEEETELVNLRRKLGFTADHAAHVAGETASDAYLALFREIAADGRITGEELEQLRGFRGAIGFSVERANEIVRKDAAELYRRWFLNVTQDDEISQAEEDGLTWLKNEFGLHHGAAAYYDARIEAIKLRSRCRNGQLPTVTTDRLLESGEICHWIGPCTFEWQTATKAKDESGELIITSRQLAFTSATKSFALSPSRIVDVQLFSNGVDLKSTTNRGNGFYRLREPQMVEAIIVGLVKFHKYQLSETFSSTKTRHIPDDIRRKVWQRDSGRCVRCQEADYLEYDHIIPHSRGGANSVGNVQLLCRRCNIHKSDRI